MKTIKLQTIGLTNVGHECKQVKLTVKTSSLDDLADLAIKLTGYSKATFSGEECIYYIYKEVKSSEAKDYVKNCIHELYS